MAMKMGVNEKTVDNVLRQYNSQMSKAYKQLGEKHTVSSNLINNAISIYGKENIRFTKDGIPQIKRNRTTVNMYTKAMKLKSESQYTQGEFKGNYKSMYDVTKAYQKAINQVRQQARNKVPSEFMKIKDLKKRSIAINKWINAQTTKANINRMLQINDMISEMYTQYNDDSDDNELINQFANDFHADTDNMNLDELEKYVTERYNQIYNPFNSKPTEGGVSLADYL